MSLTNPMGDFEVTDPKAMRALAHPARLAILTHLQRHGPATATQLSTVVAASPSVISWHLRHLAGFGLVEDWDGGTDARQRWWKAVARGFRFELPAEPEGTTAYRMLSGQLFQTNVQQAQEWFADVEPRLDDVWRAKSGTSNTRLLLTAEELAEIEDTIDRLLGRYVTRPSDSLPAGARSVRVLRFFMPEADAAEDAT